MLRGRAYEDIRDSYFQGVDGYLYMDTETTSQYYRYVIGTNEEQHKGIQTTAMATRQQPVTALRHKR